MLENLATVVVRDVQPGCGPSAVPLPSPVVEIDDPREMFEAHLEHIDRVVSWSCHRSCLTAHDAEDFRSSVHLELIKDDYRILRKFSGRSSLTTFLTVVIQNLGRDFRSRRWGRWRPSAEADRLGVVAVQLETLVHRDEFSLQESIEILHSNFAVRQDREELTDLFAKLPRRTKRHRENAELLAAVESRIGADDRVEASERTATLERTRSALNEALKKLDAEDRLVLRMHYQNGFTIAAIASTLGFKQRSLYTRRDACLRKMKECLESKGLDAEQALTAVCWSGSAFEIDFRTPQGGVDRGSFTERKGMAMGVR